MSGTIKRETQTLAATGLAMTNTDSDEYVPWPFPDDYKNRNTVTGELTRSFGPHNHTD